VAERKGLPLTRRETKTIKPLQSFKMQGLIIHFVSTAPLQVSQGIMPSQQRGGLPVNEGDTLFFISFS